MGPTRDAASVECKIIDTLALSLFSYVEVEITPAAAAPFAHGENSLFDTIENSNSLFDNTNKFLPYLTPRLNFFPYMTLPFSLLVSSVSFIFLGPIYP
jgi:hypothetical protein